jgi:hypothetical protein
MNYLLRLVLLLLLMLSASSVHAQTQKKPVKKTVATQKTQQQKSIEAKAAAREKAKADSAAAVHALALKLAREMFVADSIKRAEEEAIRIAAQKKHAELLEEQERARKLAAEASMKNKGTGGGSFGIGLKGLGNTNFTQPTEGNSFVPAIGFGLGLITSLRLSERHALVLEFLFNRNNYKVDYSGSSYTMYDDQLQVPLLYRWHLKGKKTRVFVNAGPYGAYVYEKWNSVNGIATEGASFALGLAVGSGAEIRLGPGWLAIEAGGNLLSNQIGPALSAGYTLFF